MAGAIPISLTDAEVATIRSLAGPRLAAFLAVLDELGWQAAREALPALAERQQPEKTEGNP
jgi:hypothetical protein